VKPFTPRIFRGVFNGFKSLFRWLIRNWTAAELRVNVSTKPEKTANMDLSKLQIKPAKRSRATSPKEIFKSLTLRGSIQNIWEPQAEALTAWEQKRDAADVVIQMSTGGGKTLVGLLIAQALVNETKGKVLYVCPTNQLVEQVASKAAECGISIATYMRGQWSNASAYDSAMGPCITNYAAVFNGKSIFSNHEVRGIIFDDAHVAGNFIRGQFTIRLAQDHPAFAEVVQLFRAHFARNGQTQQLEDASSGDWLTLLFVPSFEVSANASRLQQILVKHRISTGDQGFSWEYLKDQLRHCAIFISGAGVEITPVLLPVPALPYFQSEVRRIYLTATLPSQVEFLRTFGVRKMERIIPGGKSGEAQRQFLFLPGEDDEERRAVALKLVERHKACIIAPSDRAAEEWCPPAVKFGRSQGHSTIQAFANSLSPEKLALAARYDGIDLPGDACRVLIISGMPVGETLIDRFIDQTLRIERLRTAHTATRVAQAIGRIFRSNTDHGAVLIASRDLERWLVDPQNLKHMPGLLQQQIKLGIELERAVEQKQATLADLLGAVLGGRKDWDKLYSENVESFEVHDQHPEPKWFVDLAERERSAFNKLWSGNHAGAAAEYASIADDAEKQDPRLSAWYRHWKGLAHNLAGDSVAATRAYVRAANERAELGRPVVKEGVISPDGTTRASGQAKRIADIWQQKGSKVLQGITKVKKSLVYGKPTNPTEESLRFLGETVGVVATRPERDVGTGPDVLWRVPESQSGAALEAKTDKQDGTQYRKKEDIGQFHDHVKWLEKAYPGEAFSKIIVGKKLQVSQESNPPWDLRVVTLDQFHSLTDRARELYEYIAGTAKSGDVALCAEKGLESLGLKWPRCIDALESSLAIDLKLIDPPESSGGD
jgi:Type III restriction enzyme, res subunit/Helicase C-terminal domain